MKILSLIISLCIFFSISPSLLLNSQAGWILTDYKGQKSLQSDQKVYFKAKNNGYHLAYKKRKFGINLGWGKTTNPNITIKGQTGGKIKVGDKIAIKIDGGEYIKYEKREWGINIVWTKDPAYEWELRNVKNEKGADLNTDELIGLYNSNEKCNEFVVFCDRKGSPTVNLGWASDCSNGIRWPGKLNDITKSDLVKVGKFLLPLALAL
ncbi:MAG: hypothetical protein WBP08_10505 [Saprospiraceae bacterium]